jgi:microcin C transport system substrate-binding protein
MGAFRIAYWDKFGRPAKLPEPTYGLGLSAWWIEPAKAQDLAAKTAQPAPAQSAPAENAVATAPAATDPAAPAPADRGNSPLSFLLYGGGALIVALVLVAVLRRKKAN